MCMPIGERTPVRIVSGDIRWAALADMCTSRETHDTYTRPYLWVIKINCKSAERIETLVLE